MSGSSMFDCCMHCSSNVQSHEQFYNLQDLGPELIEVIERVHRSMDIDHSILCDGCLTIFLKHIEADQLSVDCSRCCICKTSIRNKRSHVLPRGPERDVLVARIHNSRMIPDDAVACFNCWSLARHYTRTSTSCTTSQSIEHPKCVVCLQSLFKKPFNILLDGPEKEYIALKIAPREMTIASLICKSCSLKMNRHLQRQLEVSSSSDSNQPQSQPQHPNNDENLAETVESSPSHEDVPGADQPHSQPEHPNSDENLAETVQLPFERQPEEASLSLRTDYNQPSTSSAPITNETVESSPSHEDVSGADQLIREIILCTWCRIPLRGVRSHLLREGLIRTEIEARIFPRQVSNASRVCHSCWLAAQRNTWRNESVDNQHSWSLGDYKRTGDTASRCFVLSCTNSERFIVPEYLKRQLFCDYKLFITPNARVCQYHKTLYNWDGIEQLRFSNRFTKRQVEQMLALKTDLPMTMALDFENIRSTPANILYYWTGRTAQQFLDIISAIPLLNDICKKPKLALGLYLIKLRTGDSNARLSSLFHISEASVSRYISKARIALITQFVPRHLGLNRLTREDMLQKNLLIPKGLFGDPANETLIGIFDGTYVYLQKSSNYSFQKKSYSLHKYRNLVKPFMAVATDGHILDVFGPYAAVTSDADIMKSLFQEGSELRQVFRPYDALILDRGFRDSIAFLSSLNYNVYKPLSVQTGETQLTTIDANKSRCVTLCRWVVEVVNGRFKRDYKLFRQVYFNTASTHLIDDFRIGAALINAFHPVIVDRPDAQEILNRANRFLREPNYLSEYVIQNNINRRRAQFISIDGELPELRFPEMTVSDLILFGLGIYQLKQARSYYGEHIRVNGSFVIEVATNVDQVNVPGLLSLQCTKLIRGRIKSRHVTNKMYNTYVLINECSLPDWENSICAYYCSCVCGQRTVGCCAHVMTIVWFLGWARHQVNIQAPALFLDEIIIRHDIENE